MDAHGELVMNKDLHHNNVFLLSSEDVSDGHTTTAGSSNQYRHKKTSIQYATLI